MTNVGSRYGSGVAVVVGAALCLAGCSQSVLPDDLVFRGAALTRGSDWSRGGLVARVFVPPGEVMPTAKLQVGIIHSRDHATGEALHAWTLERFSQSPLAGSHVSRGHDEACKTGTVDLGDHGPRTFIAIHVCRTGLGAAACAEVDEALSLDDAGCAGDFLCAQRLCDGRWAAARADLEPILTRVLATR